jgi:3',5'-cyclic AMP phosphodiesterase CpdA
MQPLASIAHLSDLHLGERLDDHGAPDKANLSSFLRKRRLEMQCHDPYILVALRTALRESARRRELPDDAFDFIAVTGDISTNATSQQRFLFARDYLTGLISDPAASFGLQLDPSRLLCVPGNHDKLFEKTPERYLGAFSALPAAPAYCVTRQTRSGDHITFLGLDSNSYEEGNIAEGNLTLANFEWLTTTLDAIDRDRAKIWRVVLLLHHHPADLNRFRRLNLGNLVMNRFTQMRDGTRLLELCRGRVDLILHGHEHFPIAFRDEISGAVIVSAGTTSEWHHKTRKNSFHTLLLREHDVIVTQHDWNGSRFEQGLEWCFPLGNGAG